MDYELKDQFQNNSYVFGFEGHVSFLIAPVPAHFLLATFGRVLTPCYFEVHFRVGH